MKKLLVLLVLLTIPHSVAAQGGFVRDIVLKRVVLANPSITYSQPVAGAPVRVCTGSGTPCTPLASIYSDSALSAAKTNPTASDINGNFSFWAAPGKYTVGITVSGTVTNFEYTVDVSDIPDLVDDIITTAHTWSGVQTFNDAKLKLNGSTSGTATLKAPAVAATNSYSLPALDATPGTLVALANANTWPGIQNFAAWTVFSARITLNSIASPTGISGNVNNYAGCDLVIVCRISTDMSRNITGLNAGNGSQLLTIINIGANDAVLTNLDAASSTANQFSLGASLTIQANEAITLWYDGTSTKWRAIGRNN